MKFIKYFSLLFSLFCFVSCQKGITDSSNNSPFAPLDEIEVSQGNKWTAANTFPDTGTSVYTITASDVTVNDSNYIFVACEYGGVFRSKDNGTSWTIRNSGLIPDDNIYGKDIYSVFASGYLGNTVFIGTANSIYTSKNNGDSWNLSYSSPNHINIFKAVNKGVIYAGCYQGVLKSTDYGKSWQNFLSGVDWVNRGNVYGIELSSKGVMFIATSRGIIKTSDNGNSWQSICVQDQIQAIKVSSKDYIYAASFNKLYLSKDDGISWEIVFTSPNNEDNFSGITNILTNKSGAVFVCCTSGIYRSTDDGKNWSQTGLPNLWPVKMIYDRLGRLIAITWRKLYISQE